MTTNMVTIFIGKRLFSTLDKMRRIGLKPLTNAEKQARFREKKKKLKRLRKAHEKYSDDSEYEFDEE